MTYGVKLKLMEEGERRIIKKAKEYNVGARGMNRIIADMLKDVEMRLMMGEEKNDVIRIGE